MSSPLRKLLEREAGWEEFRMIIPYPFLPPRFQKLASNRNMILLLDQDLTLNVRWEGARMHEHHPLTPRAASRLIRDVLEHMSKYRRELGIFSRFVERYGALPFDDQRCLDPIRTKQRKLPPAFREEGRGEEDTSTDVVATISLAKTEMGGESPMPMMEEFDGG